MRRLFYATAAASAIMAASLASCSEECTQNKNALPLAGYYSSLDPTQQLSVDSLEIYGAGAPGDSVLVDGKSPRTQAYLPFRIDRDETVYVFRLLQREAVARDIRDTVRFSYTREPHFVNTACGVSYIFRIRSITTTGQFIDSVVCPRGEIDNTNSENLRIYFRTDPAAS